MLQAIQVLRFHLLELEKVSLRSDRIESNRNGTRSRSDMKRQKRGSYQEHEPIELL